MANRDFLMRFSMPLWKKCRYALDRVFPKADDTLLNFAERCTYDATRKSY